MGQRLNGRSKRGDRIRLEILRSAARRFRDRGFDATSMQEIADGAQMTKGNLYYYFKNKQQLIYFTQIESLRRLFRIVARVSRLRLGVAQKLQAVIEAHARCVLDEMHAGAAHTEVQALDGPRRSEVVRLRNRYEGSVRALVSTGVRKKIFEAVNSKLAVLSIMGSLNWAARWYRPDGPWSVERIARDLADMHVRGLLRRPERLLRIESSLLEKVMA